MTCTHCGKNPGVKPSGLFKGFRDADTGELVCWPCRPLHYQRKAKTAHAGKYSEVPVMGEAVQLMLTFGLNRA